MAQLFIGQLPFSKFFPDDLLNLFRPYGNVVAHQLHIRQGNAFVTYATTDEADAAIRALHGQCALGTRSQPIQVMYSKGTRLISPFGLQHRSLCLARNKERQRSKEMMSGSGASSANNNNDSVSLNDGAASGLFGGHQGEYTSVLYATGAKEYNFVGDVSGAGGNGGGSGGASAFVNYGLGDISFDEEGRQTVGSGVLSNSSFYSLNTSANRQMQQQQQSYMPGFIGVDPAMYGTPVKLAIAQPQSSVMLSASTTPVQASSNETPSRLSSPAAPPLPPPTVSYFVMRPSAQTMTMNMGVPAGMPVCYVMPASTTSAYMTQQQQTPSMSTVLTPFGTAATVLSPPLAYIQVRPMC